MNEENCARKETCGHKVTRHRRVRVPGIGVNIVVCLDCPGKDGELVPKIKVPHTDSAIKPGFCSMSPDQWRTAIGAPPTPQAVTDGR
jgi:hypothetical protein